MPQASHCSCHEGRIHLGYNSVYHVICKSLWTWKMKYINFQNTDAVSEMSMYWFHNLHTSEFKLWKWLGNSALYIINDNDSTFQCSVSFLMIQHSIQIFYQEWKKTYLEMNEWMNTALHCFLPVTNSIHFLTLPRNSTAFWR